MKYTVEVKQDVTYWRKEGTNILHRENGPAAEWANGTKEWYIDGKRHRENGPACEYSDNYKAWYKNDKLHREDGPAREYINGDKEYFINGVPFTEEQFNKRNKKSFTVEELKNMTMEELHKIIS